jgi:hypothetical protein
MEWYWWVLIAIAAAIIGYIKLKVWKMVSEKKNEKEAEPEDDY